jgi:hypothetical protein
MVGAEMSKPAKTASKPPLTREQAMDIAARKTFAEMDRVNSDRSLEYKIMNERDPNPLAPQPSQRNAAAASIPSADLMFSRVGGDFANSTYMRSRRPPGGG